MMIKHIVFAVMLLLPSVGFAQSLPMLEEFTPLKQRKTFNRYDLIFVQYTDEFCPKCEQQIKEIEKGLAELENVDFMENSAGLFVNMDIWQDDPFVKEQDIDLEPTLIVYHKRKVIARFVRRPATSDVVEAFSPLVVVPQPLVPVIAAPAADGLDYVDDDGLLGVAPVVINKVEDVPEGMAYSPDPDVSQDFVPSIESNQKQEEMIPVDDGGEGDSSLLYETIRQQLGPNEELIIIDGMPKIVVKE